MKALLLLLSLLCAVLVSVLAAILASGKLNPPPEVQEEEEEIVTKVDLRASIFPEQSRAVEELLKAILARQESVERQETLLNEREEQIRVESAVLARMREELAVAKQEIEAYLKQMDEMAVGWDADERKNTRKLAEFYARMEPQNAARLLSELEPERVARILTFLSDRQAGAIMDASVGMGPNGIDLAVQWTEIIRQMKEPRTNPP